MLKLFRFKDFINPNLNLPQVMIPGDNKGIILTKSRFMQGLKCDLLLWNQYHSDQTIRYSPRNESNLQRVNIQNESVYKFAKSIYSNGKEVPRNLNMHAAHRMTQELLQSRDIVYNASFLSTEYFSKSNILKPAIDGETWEIIEVKPSINIKQDNFKDISFQFHVAQSCGVKISKCFILHINPNYMYEGELDINQLFTLREITEKINSSRVEFKKELEYRKSLIYQKEIPQITVEHSCSTPKNCILKTCWGDLGDANIFNLREGSELALKFYNLGIKYIKDIPEDPDLSATQKIQIAAEKLNQPIIEKQKLDDFLKTIQFPLYFLDFETINPAIPIYKKSKPFQHVPFLYSLHVMANKDMPLEHYSFIDDGESDPREKILSELSKLITAEGTILCYNAVFEMKCLRESVKLFPEFTDWHSSISEKFIDLSNPFRFFYYYHPKQNGSASLKSVLPALTGLDYKELAIADGNLANLEFLRAKTMQLSQEEITEIYQLLKNYCKMDTFAMVNILEALWKLV